MTGQPMGELGHGVLARRQQLGWGTRYPMSLEAERPVRLFKLIEF